LPVWQTVGFAAQRVSTIKFAAHSIRDRSPTN
jgi:hypothetical protein